MVTVGLSWVILVGVDYVEFLIAGRSGSGRRPHSQCVKRVKNDSARSDYIETPYFPNILFAHDLLRKHPLFGIMRQLDAVKAALYTSGRLPRINELTGAAVARTFYEG